MSRCRGVDNIGSAVTLSSSLPSMAHPLVEIINCSFKVLVFSLYLKIAKVVPIFKKGSREETSIYRPIWVLPFFSKVFEKPTHEHLNNVILKSQILFLSEHGFQSEHSAFMSRLSMQDKTSAAIDNNEFRLESF